MTDKLALGFENAASLNRRRADKLESVAQPRALRVITTNKDRLMLRRGDATRNDILLAAAHLFSEKGYNECSLRELAAMVGMKPGSFYYHFKSKEEVLDELLNAGIALLTNEVNKALASLDPDASVAIKIAAAIRAHITPFLDKNDKTKAIMRIWEHLPPALKHRNRNERRTYAEIWKVLIEQGIRSGVVRTDIDAKILVPFMLGSMNRVVEWYNPKYMTIDQVCRTIQTIYLNGGATLQPHPIAVL